MQQRVALPPHVAGTLDQDVNFRAQESRSILAWLRNMPCFALSAMLHLIVLLALVHVVSQESREETGTPTGCGIGIQIAPTAPSRPPPYDPTRDRGVKRRDQLQGLPPLTDRNLVKLTESTTANEVIAEIPRGRSLEELTDFNTDYSGADAYAGWNRSIGTGPGVAGAHGLPDGTGSFDRGEASPVTECAVRAALEWLRRHQDSDGSWKAAKYTRRCQKHCTQAHGDGRHGGDAGGFDSVDVGVTALAMLAFSGHGQTHRDGLYEEYVDCMRRAVEYLKRVQVHSEDPGADGRFGDGNHEHWIYNHLIATLAMAELYLISGDGLGLRKPVTAAVKLVLRAQNDGFGWRYGIQPGDNDTSVTGWAILALKTAKNVKLDIPAEAYHRAFDGAINWINRATAASGKAGYQAPGDEGSRLAGIFPEPYPFTRELSCMTAVAVLCRLFAGESHSSPTVRRGVDLLMTHLPRWQESNGRILSSINFYYWYYGSYALFQFGGQEWKKWNQEMINALVKTQRQGLDLCEDGSWDPIDEWGPAGGRVYATALGAMTLEVYYRYQRLLASAQSPPRLDRPGDR